MTYNNIEALMSLIGRTPTTEELKAYHRIEEKYKTELEKRAVEYRETPYVGKSDDSVVSITLRHDFTVQSVDINTGKDISIEELPERIKVALEKAMDEATLAYKTYVALSPMLSANMTREVLDELGEKQDSMILPNSDSKILN